MGSEYGGVVVKQCASPYEPGRRGYGWVKFKETEGKQGKLTDTIDAVVMGYYRGQGKRILRAILARYIPPRLFERPKIIRKRSI